MNADRTLPTDARWALLAPLLPGRAGRRGGWPRATGALPRPCAGGRPGLPWRDRPPHLSRWPRGFGRFSRGRPSGVWARVPAALPALGQAVPGPRQRQVQPDPPTGRAHRRAAGARKKRAAGARAWPGRPFHQAARGRGRGRRPAGPRPDGRARPAMPPRPPACSPPLLAPARQVLADTACDSDALRAQIAEAGAVAVVPPRPNRLVPHRPASTRSPTAAATGSSGSLTASSSSGAGPPATISSPIPLPPLSNCAPSLPAYIENTP